jgi:SNF2 family DNA or RNA helicase
MIFVNFAASKLSFFKKNIMESYQLVYIISPFAGDENIFLPAACIARVKKTGLGYPEKFATYEVIDSFDIIFKNTPHELALKLIDELHPDALVSKLVKKQRKMPSLLQISQDEKIRPILRSRIDRILNEFLLLVKANGYPIVYDINRKSNMDNHRLVFSENSLNPLLSFEKTQMGINYGLKLSLENQVLIPCQRDIHVLTNQPPWLILDGKLMTLENINANKLTPFLKKEKIFIPDRLSEDYFKKFILDVLGKVDVETTGFDVIEIAAEPKPIIAFTKDFIRNKYIINLKFDYQGIIFHWQDPNPKRIRLDYHNSEKIEVKQTTRNKKTEKYFVDALLQNAFIQTSSGHFEQVPSNNDPFAIFEYTATLQDKKQLQDFLIEAPIMSNNRSLTIKTPQIAIAVDKEIDWFDLHGHIAIGDFLIPVSKLFLCIRNDNRELMLPDGSVMIIPLSWMAKYEKIARFGEEDGDSFKLRKANFRLIEELEEDGGSESQKSFVIKEEDFHFSLPKGLNATLRSYQIEGAKWLVKHRKNQMGACLADDMGLGKTLQTITALLNFKEELKSVKGASGDHVKYSKGAQLSLFDLPGSESHSDVFLKALIVVPASLVYNWYNEITKFAPEFKCLIYGGKDRKGLISVITKCDVVICNYNVFLVDTDYFKKIEWNYLVLDESHRIRNRKSKTFQNINQLSAKFKISLSGTPIENSLADLWSQMEFINPEILGSYEFFKKHFQNPIEKERNSEALSDLKKIVEPFLLRRTKQQVLPDLPDMVEQFSYCEMSKEQSELFERERSAARNFLLTVNSESKDYRFHVLAALTRLRQISNHPRLYNNELEMSSGKFDQVMDYIETVRQSGSKMLVFSSFVEHLRLFEREFRKQKIKYAMFSGADNSNKREQEIERFVHHEDVSIFLISLKAGGVGLNLTQADYVLILDPWWNPFAELQAIGRAHRIGQENKVIVTRFISSGSIEEKILKLQEKKLKISADILDIDEKFELKPEWVDDLLA